MFLKRLLLKITSRAQFVNALHSIRLVLVDPTHVFKGFLIVLSFFSVCFYRQSSTYVQTHSVTYINHHINTYWNQSVLGDRNLVL